MQLASVRDARMRTLSAARTWENARGGGVLCAYCTELSALGTSQAQLHPSSRGASQAPRRGRPPALWGNAKAWEHREIDICG